MAVAVITGASVGIGLETAIGLAQKGYNLVLVSRNLNKLTRVKENIEIQYNVNCKIYSFDLSLIKENITFFKQVFKDYNTVDVLINNVGAIYMSRVVTEEGLEKTFALNHMSYFVLSKLFSENLKPQRIINVSSEAHRGLSLNSNDFQNSENYNGWHAYKRSKLANIYTTYELNRRLDDNSISVNCLHPGLVNSDFANNNALPYKIMSSFIKYFGISTKEGALTSIYLASDEDIKNASGMYFDKCIPRKSSSVSYDKDVAQELWHYNDEIFKKIN